MTPVLRALLALVILALGTGCEINRVMTIKPDGSGQISERFVTGRDAYVGERPPPKPGGSMIEMMQPGLKQPTADVVAKQGEKYGEGIKLVSYKRVETKEALGYEAVYSFPDVTKIRADLFVDNGGGIGIPGAVESDGTPRYFQFSKGSPNELRVPLDQKKKEEASKEATPTPTPEPTQSDPKQQEAMLGMMKHQDSRVTIRVEGNIVETNSHYRNGNEVVLNQLNLKGMLSDPKYEKAIKSAATAGKTSPDDLPPDEKYIKQETVEVLSIRFK